MPFLPGRNATIKYTILQDKKNNNSINLDENDDKILDKLSSIITEGNLEQNIKNKIMLVLLKKSKQNLEQKNEIINKLKEVNEQCSSTNSQIQNLNEEIEHQNLFLKKIKSLYIFLVNLLARKNNFNMDKNAENKINTGNNEIIKKSGSKTTLFDFVNRYVNFRWRKDFLGFLSTMNKNKLSSLNKKNNYIKNKALSNIVQRGENFSIKNENFDDYLNNIEMLSFKSRKSGKFNDSFSISLSAVEDKNFNSSFSFIDNSNLNGINFDNSNYKTNQNLLSDDILF